MKFVTIVARNYLPQASTLGASLLLHEDERLTIVVADLAAAEPLELDEADTVSAADIGIAGDELARMATIYTITEFCTALKPFALRWLLARGDDAVVYLDPDMVLLQPLFGLDEQLGKGQLVLTPHVLRPLPRDGLETSEYTLRRCGIFNLGFLAVNASAGPFLDWFAERMLRDAIADPQEMLYTDQKWLDWAPSLFDVAVWRDEGVNVAYWNVHERDVRMLDGRYLAGTAPLRLFHFSGFPQDAPTTLSTRPGARYRFDPAGNPAVTALCQWYAGELDRRGLRSSSASPYGFAVTPSGVVLTPPIRRVFRTATLEAERRGDSLPPTPFTDERGFTRWLAEVESAGRSSSGISQLRRNFARALRIARRAMRPVRSAWRRIGRTRTQRA